MAEKEKVKTQTQRDKIIEKIKGLSDEDFARNMAYGFCCSENRHCEHIRISCGRCWSLFLEGSI